MARRADLRGCDLTGADLARADLTGADLRLARLTDADLRGARLTGADLRGANLTGADMRGADMSGADLSGAKLTVSVRSDAGKSGAPVKDATDDTLGWPDTDQLDLVRLYAQNERLFIVRRCVQRFRAGEITAAEGVQRIRRSPPVIDEPF